MKHIILPFAFALVLLLAACAPTERIYDMTEVGQSPLLVGDSLIFEAERLPPHPDTLVVPVDSLR